MRRVFTLLLLMLFLIPVDAARPAGSMGGSVEALKFIKEYRNNPDPRPVPALIKTLSERGGFKDAETSGVYLGFFAGVLGSNPRGARTLIEQTLPLPFEDQWVLIRAIAYSGLPHWRELMQSLSPRLPDRRLLIGHFLSGKLPTLDQVRLEVPKRTTMDKVKSIFKRETYMARKGERPREFTFASNPELIDTYWGIYFATGKQAPIERIVTLLPWSGERDDVEKLTIGGMAKFTLAANATRDAKLLRLLKSLHSGQPKTVKPLVREVIEAAETADIGRIKREALASVEELRTKGPGSKREVAWWGKVGQTTLSLGCLGAAVTGQVEFGIPCVVGGALSSAALNYFASP